MPSGQGSIFYGNMLFEGTKENKQDDEMAGYVSKRSENIFAGKFGQCDR
jgi:hypothetical protein